MASERQIAANRKNARKSKGPRSEAGRKRSSQNARQHGLSLPIAGFISERKIEALAREIAGDTQNEIRLVYAREAAEAELELQRIRRLRVALYDRIHEHGWLDPRKVFSSDKEERKWVKKTVARLLDGGPRNVPSPDLTDLQRSMPKDEPSRSAEAARRLLPELLTFLRYEERAASRKNRALRNMMQS
jgi:hypothetical protein